jgi:hypothetical protein
MAMPRTRKRPRKSDGTEYRFRIDAYTPETIPMSRLAEYMSELATILGERSSVHFERLEPGSTVIVHRVEREAAPKVRDRIDHVRTGEAAGDALRAFAKVNKMLQEDDGTGTLREKRRGGVVILFPGREQAAEKFASVRQAGAIDGEVIWAGGDDIGHITLKSEGREISRITVSKTVAKELAKKLYEPVRLFGRGKWSRDSDGAWTLLEFKAEYFEPLEDVPLSTALERLRAIPTEWTDESYSELSTIRRGPSGGKRNGGH